MKKLLLLTGLFVAGYSFAQSKITLTIDGLTDEVNAALQPGEFIQNMEGVDSKEYVLFVDVQNSAGGSSKYVSIRQDIRPNAEGKYDFSLQVDVDQTGSLDFSKEIVVKINAVTTFGNDVWAEKTLVPADFAKPIKLDNYGVNSRYQDKPPKDKMKFIFKYPRKSDEITKTVEAAGDALKTPTYADFRLKIKNEGEEKWLINDSPVRGSISGKGQYDYTLDPKTSGLDLNKPVVVYIQVKTVNDGLVWAEYVLQPWELGGKYPYAVNYEAEPVIEEPVVEEVEEEVEEEVVEEKEEEKEEEVAEETTEDSTTEDGPEVIPTVVKIQKCNVDSITQKLTLAGGQLCVKHAKVFRGTTNSAILLYDTEYTVDGVKYTLQGGKPVYYHNKANYLMGGTLAEAITVNHPLGQLKLASNKKIEFTQIGLYAAKLSEDALIEYNGKKIVCKMTAEEYDIEFDKQSKLRAFTLAQAIDWTIGSTLVNLPAGSSLSFKKDNLYSVTLQTATSVQLGEQKFTVAIAKKGPSMIFADGDILKSFTVGAGHSTTVDGKEISINTGSEMELTYDGSAYIVSAVETAETVTMEVHKGSKVKTVDVKAGKRLIIEGGKVVKVK